MECRHETILFIGYGLIETFGDRVVSIKFIFLIAHVPIVCIDHHHITFRLGSNRKLKKLLLWNKLHYKLNHGLLYCSGFFCRDF